MERDAERERGRERDGARKGTHLIGRASEATRPSPPSISLCQCALLLLFLLSLSLSLPRSRAGGVVEVLVASLRRGGEEKRKGIKATEKEGKPKALTDG